MSSLPSRGDTPSPLRDDTEIELRYVDPDDFPVDVDPEDVPPAMFWPRWTDFPIEAHGYSVPDLPSSWDGRSR